jgi:dipeptidyl aminopeptidase/acylaminoacyl peptidase
MGAGMNTLKIFVILLFSVFLSSCVTLSERWFLYPEQYSDLPLDATSNLRSEEISFITKDGAKLSGMIIRNSLASDYLIYFYGNMESIKKAAKRLYFLSAEYGFNVICFDYRGYGKSTGKASFENLPTDGAEVYDFVRQNYCRDNCGIYMYSQSLGTVPCTYTGGRRNFKAIVMEAPFTNAEEAVSQMTEGLMWPFNSIIHLKAEDALVAKDNQPIENIKKFTAPLLILHGEKDNCFPVRAGEKMYNAAGSKEKYFCRLPDTMHADVNIYQGRAYEEMKVFFKKYRDYK